MWRILALVSLAAGCGAHLGDGDQNGNRADANNNGSSDSNGSNGGRMDAAVDAPPACANGRVLYLNFDGVTITQGSPSDATVNRTNWLTNASAAVPPYHQGSGTRAADITSIVDGAKLRLQGTPIQVVTARPPAGSKYVMIVFGGTRAADGGTVGTQYTYATNEHDCGDVVKNDLGWISDVPAVDLVPDLVMGTIGWGVGLNGTNNVNDCMCGWANACSNAAGACTISASIASTTSSGNTTCANQNPQNEVAAFSTGFCQ
ncbi:MAG TPA: hypothetical protein VL326_20985 [Kofleriaceae bacterium]|jgi:hypothetical protein|nr:hypothetical protein [Kofleriaceae bacterium]